LAEVLIANIILATINTFADTISYIRLFAVGLATLAVAQSFNDIALQIGFGNIFAGLGAALILFVGHALNIALAAMAVIVHGVRLNMLEFSGHVGNTWSGYQYTPFRKRFGLEPTDVQ
jgi:V/A-type H+-transporting ATPase subunit I